MYVTVTLHLISLIAVVQPFKTFLNQIRKVDYCKPNLTCSDAQHTICMRSHDCRGNPNCSPLEINPSFRRTILHKHNEYRNHFAEEKEVGNMKVLNYDLELEYIARCWANICAGNSDSCRKSRKFSKVGQNEFRATSIGGVPEEHLTIEYTQYAIERWFSEQDLVEKWGWWGVKAEKTSRRFFQLIWPETTHIGCARSKSEKVFMLYCNYGPGVDFGTDSMKFGDPPCTACIHDCNKEFKNLCGSVEPVQEEIFSASVSIRDTHFLLLTLLLVFNYI